MPGNYVIVDGTVLYWDEAEMRWRNQDTEPSGDTTIDGIVTADEVVVKDGFRTSDFVNDTQGSALRKSNGEWLLSVDRIKVREGMTIGEEEVTPGDAGVLGQTWVSSNLDVFVVDCDKDGKALTTQSLDLWGELMYGDTNLTLDTAPGKCVFNEVSISRAATFSYSNTRASHTFTFNQGDTVSLRQITIVLTSVSTNGNVYLARKTVSVIANKQGTVGSSGPIVRFLGAWSSSLNPVWNGEFRDCVKHNDVFWLVAVPADGTTQLGEPGNSNTNWLNIGNMRFIATELLLAENAAINLLSSQTINLFNVSGIKTASINADGNGEYCIHYPTGGKRMTFSYDGFIHYYREDGTEAWRIGMGGDIEKFATAQFVNFPLCSLSGMSGAIEEEDTFTLDDTYWQYRCGTSGILQYDRKIYAHTSDSVAPTNPATQTVIPDGRYTPDATPHQVVSSMDSTGYAITVYVIEGGFITQTLELTEL